MMSVGTARRAVFARILRFTWVAGVLFALGACSDVLVERYERCVDRYFLFTRVVDTLVVRNENKDLKVRKVFIPAEERELVRYYDALGKIHTYLREGPLHLFGLRYPLGDGERISFTVERIRPRGASSSYAPVLPDAACLQFVQEESTFPFWETTFLKNTESPTEKTVRDVTTDSQMRPGTRKTNYRKKVFLTTCAACFLGVCLRRRKTIG